MPPKCHVCFTEAVEAILDMNGKDGRARKIWRCPKDFNYLGPIPEVKTDYEKVPRTALRIVNNQEREGS